MTKLRATGFYEGKHKCSNINVTNHYTYYQNSLYILSIQQHQLFAFPTIMLVLYLRAHVAWHIGIHVYNSTVHMFKNFRFETTIIILKYIF